LEFSLQVVDQKLERGGVIIGVVEKNPKIFEGFWSGAGGVCGESDSLSFSWVPPEEVYP
jgi:hypothetical protein